LLKVHWRRGEGQGASLKLSVNKWQEGQQQVRDRLLPEVGKEQRRQTTGLSPGHPQSDGSAAWRNHHNRLTADRSLTLPLPQGKG
jgi:hypothetical protein